VFKNTVGSKISAIAVKEGLFLEATLPLQAIATLTTFLQASQMNFDDAFRRWLRDLQEHHHMTIGFIKAQEYEGQRHVHVGLIAAAPLDCSYAERRWRAIAAPRYRQATVVRPNRDEASGLWYVLKSLGTPTEEIQFSDNLTAFAIGNRKSLFRSTSAQRRQRRRIGAQLKKHSSSLLPPPAGPCSPMIKPEWLSVMADK
jgi:hypothetical protein